jgi:hypothetical protein
MARKMGYYPADPDACLINDWIVETYYDYYDILVSPSFAALTGGSQQDIDAAMKKVFGEIIPKMLKQFAPYLKSKCKFTLSDNLHLCDFVLGTFYTDLVTNPQCFGR